MSSWCSEPHALDQLVLEGQVIRRATPDFKTTQLVEAIIKADQESDRTTEGSRMILTRTVYCKGPGCGIVYVFGGNIGGVWVYETESVPEALRIPAMSTVPLIRALLKLGMNTTMQTELRTPAGQLWIKPPVHDLLPPTQEELAEAAQTHCLICHEGYPVVVAIPCCHRTLCLECAQENKEPRCLSCQEPVTAFYVSSRRGGSFSHNCNQTYSA